MGRTREHKSKETPIMIKYIIRFFLKHRPTNLMSNNKQTIPLASFYPLSVTPNAKDTAA
jgi:hypothetical protein